MNQAGHSERKHALLSASGSFRWLNCTPSARLEEEMGIVESTSEYAEEGTKAHELAETILRRTLGVSTAAEYSASLDSIKKSSYYNEEMQSEVEKYTDYVMEEFSQAKRITLDASILIEQRIDLTAYIEDGFGSNDSIIVADGVMEVIDLKYGKGIPVAAQDNSQLKLYGLGALHKFGLSFDIKTVRLTIVQPRLDNFSSWDIPAEDLILWGETFVREKAKAAYAGTGETIAGAWCKWCKVAPRCIALKNEATKEAKLEFSDPALLSEEEMVAAYLSAPMFDLWFGAVSSHMLSEAMKGTKFSGLKLVEGRSNRKWSDETAVIEAIGKTGLKEAEFTNTKVKGIGDVEKLLGKQFQAVVGPLVIKPQGKPTLVAESDKRPAMGAESAKFDFSE